MRLIATLVLAHVVVCAASDSIVLARNMSGTGDANACVQIVWERRTTATMIRMQWDYDYWHFTIRNTCPHAIEFHYCFFRYENSTCGTRNAYYQKVQTIRSYDQYGISDPNPIRVLRFREKNTKRLEWLACPAGSGMPKPGLWQDARSCKG